MSKKCMKTLNPILETANLNGFPVDILKMNPLNEKLLKKLILIIPGNPGVVDYYSDFIQELYKELGESTAVWAISHCCHCLQEQTYPENHSNTPLEVEIEHKLRFLEQEVPKDCDITLVGHSIGCYMIQSVMQILLGTKKRIEFADASSTQRYSEKNLELYSKINKCCFLFPTIERMKVSPNGARIWPVLNYLQFLAVFAISLMSWLPLWIRRKGAAWYLGNALYSETLITATVNLLTPRLFSNMLKLAHNELNSVTSLNVDAIQSIKNKLIFYFGTSDGWCPLFYRDELVQKIPDIHNIIDDQNIRHAFVLGHSNIMAKKLAEILE